MKQATTVVLALVAFSLVCWLCVQYRVPLIESDLTERTRVILTDLRLDAVDVSLSGRDATLSGSVPTAAASSQAIELVGDLRGMRRVDGRLSMAAPPAIAADIEDTLLSGAVPTADAPVSAGDETAVAEPAPAAHEAAVDKAAPAADAAATATLQKTLEELAVEDPVQFQTDRSDLLTSSTAALDRVAAALRLHPGGTIEISEHADSTGTPDYNLPLSTRRANSARDYLVQLGIRVDRLQTVGHGSDMPVADNSSADGRRSNRRVEFRVMEH